MESQEANEKFGEAIGVVGSGLAVLAFGTVIKAMLELGMTPGDIGGVAARMARQQQVLENTPEAVRTRTAQDQLMQRALDAAGDADESDLSHGGG